MEQEDEPGAFGFEGRWQEYAPIAFTNLLLAIVTLGIYRFWGKARTRRYLWSRTRFIDDRLEWAGTGLELFKGAILALVAFVLPYFLLNMLAQSLILHGNAVAGGIIMLSMLALLYYLIGVARFRGLRYKLSRTYWRGIRGGSEDPGFAYGWSAMWKNTVGTLALGLLIPWSMVALWNDRWNRMSFGPHRFTASGQVQGLMGRFLLCYLAPFLGAFALIAAMAPAFMAGGIGPNTKMTGAAALGLVAGIFAFYFVIGLVLMAYYAKFFRQMVEATSLDTLEFRFSASTMDWIKLLLGDALLVVGTLGIGLIFLDYRHWKFFISHMEGYGHIDVEELTQSSTPELRQGEGLLDAFDMGAL